jgi:hypothetical protein
MNDERIIAYLRSRAVVEPPPGLGAEVSAAVDAALVPRNPFSSLLPTVAAIAIVGVVAAALLVTQRPAGGPATSEAGLPSPSATAHPSFPIAADDPRFVECAGLLYRDRVIAAFPIMAADYHRHLPNMGRSPELEVEAPAFLVVFDVGVVPPGLSGGVGSRPPPTGHTVCVYLGEPQDGVRTFYGDVDIAGMRADIGSSAQSSATPSPVSTALPATSPQPGYVAVEGLPITVLDNAEADELFRDVQTCTSVAGYTVTFPATWYTNAASRDVPACSWFGPEPFDGSIRPVVVKPPPPEGAWLVLEVVDGGAGYTTITPIYMSEPISVGGHDGHRAEFGPSTLDEITSRPEFRAYWCVITLGEHFPTFIAYTNVDYAGDYPLAKAVMDRMVASVTFEPR